MSESVPEKELLTWMDRMYRMRRIRILEFQISDLKFFYPAHPVHPC
jgi:hypothetical protein